MRRKTKTILEPSLLVMTNKSLFRMHILDSEGSIRFLRDTQTNYYVVFNGRLNQAYISKDRIVARREFFRQIA